MIRFDRFGGGKKHALVMSFDDGRKEDEDLICILNEFGLRATFHLFSAPLDALSDKHVDIKRIAQLYAGHEIAAHTHNHARLINACSTAIVEEVITNRKFLECIVKKPVVGFAYPFGENSQTVFDAVKACGIKYARTTNVTGSFCLPDNFGKWDPTCHVLEAVKYWDFLKTQLDKLGKFPLFFTYGHSFEFDDTTKLSWFKRFCEDVSSTKDFVWNSTCEELYLYIFALKNLLISADEKIITNPSHISVWVSIDKEPVEIKGGETLNV